MRTMNNIAIQNAADATSAGDGESTSKSPEIGQSSGAKIEGIGNNLIGTRNKGQIISIGDNRSTRQRTQAACNAEVLSDVDVAVNGAGIVEGTRKSTSTCDIEGGIDITAIDNATDTAGAGNRDIARDCSEIAQSSGAKVEGITKVLIGTRHKDQVVVMGIDRPTGETAAAALDAEVLSGVDIAINGARVVDGAQE